MIESQADKAFPGGIGPDIFEALVSEPDVGVVILAWDLRVVFINTWAARFYLDCEPDDVVGKTSKELFGREVAAAHRSNIARMLESGKPLLMRSLWRGKQVRVTFRRIPGENATGDQFLTVHRLIRAGDPDAFEAGTEFEPRISDMIDLGPLDALSPREIEVLALVGQGLSIKEIAQILGRSVKTIDNHRHSIGQKLGMSDRLELAEAAREAGLRVDDAKRERVQTEKN